MYILLQTFAQKDFQCMDLLSSLTINSQPTLIRPAGEIQIGWNVLDKELNALFSFILYYKINE